jgi:hypothetical protein
LITNDEVGSVGWRRDNPLGAVDGGVCFFASQAVCCYETAFDDRDDAQIPSNHAVNAFDDLVIDADNVCHGCHFFASRSSCNCR